MSKYVIKNCPGFNDTPNISGEVYGYCDNEHCLDLDKSMCENINNCVMKQIVENLKQVAHACHCDNCDGCGYHNGCSDTECGTYQALKSLELLDIQEVE